MRWMIAAALLAVSSGALYAQAPPIKMGLWEKTLTTSGGVGGDATMKAKSCVTAETWQQMLSNASKQHAGCNINRTQSGNTYSYSGSCALQHVTMTMKGSTTIRDAEHITSESQTTTVINGKTRQAVMKDESHFVSSNCGSVKPGEPEIEE